MISIVQKKCYILQLENKIVLYILNFIGGWSRFKSVINVWINRLLGYLYTLIATDQLSFDYKQEQCCHQ